MLNLIKATLIVLFFGISLLFTSHCFAGDFIELDEVNVKYISFFPGGRDPLITENGLLDRQLDKELDFNLNTDILHYLYWDSFVQSMTDDVISTGHGQFRMVGLNMRLGVRLTDWLSVGYWHFSKHTLDTTYQYGGFPVQDGVELNIRIFSKDKHRESIF